MLIKKTPSLFKADKREQALERIARGVIVASENSLAVISNIAAICQNPSKHSKQHNLIERWANDLFMYRVQLIIDGIKIEDILPSESITSMSSLFFDYIISIVPFFYEKKNINAIRAILNKGKYKWTSEDYKELQKKIVYMRFQPQVDDLNAQWNDLDMEIRFAKESEIQSKVNKAYHLMGLSSVAISSFRNKQQKINSIVSTEHLELKVSRMKPDFKYQYQSDLYILYTQEFIKLIPKSFEIFDNNFYEAGDYLHKFFQWSGR